MNYRSGHLIQIQESQAPKKQLHEVQEASFLSTSWYPETSSLLQLDDSKPLHEKWLSNQTSIKTGCLEF